MEKDQWVETTLDQIVLHKKGKKPIKLESAPFKNALPYINIEAFETGKIMQYADFESSSHCESKDVLVVWDGARFGLSGTNQKGAVGSTLACLTPVIIESCYLHKFIQRHYRTIQQKPKGMATPHVDPEVFWNLEFPLPPLREQERIVEKLDTILPKVKSTKARLEKIPVILKKFRQSVLAAACSGRLTEDWREGKSELFKPDIKNKLERRIIEDFSADYEKQDIPEVWSWQIIDDVASVKGGKRLPKGTSFSNVQTKFPYIMAGALKNGTVLSEKLAFIEKETQHKIKQYIVAGGDVYITIVGACIGDAGIIPETLSGANLTENALKITAFNQINNKYLSLWLRSLQAQSFIKSTILSCAQGKLALGRVKAFPIPVPPPSEQYEIVRRVEKLFALADSLEAKYKKAMARVEKIEQSVLAKAFRGELVEPDPNDEPAEELLKRILEEKAKLEGRKKPRKKSKGVQNNIAKMGTGTFNESK